MELSKSVCCGSCGMKRQILGPSCCIRPSGHGKVSRCISETCLNRDEGGRWLSRSVPKHCVDNNRSSHRHTLTPLLSSSSWFTAWGRQPASRSRATRKPQRTGRWRRQTGKAARKEKAANATAGPEGELVLLIQVLF